MSDGPGFGRGFRYCEAMAKQMVEPVAVAQMCKDVGFVGWQVVRMGQIAMAESGLNALALGVNFKPGAVDHLSIDCGLFMLNDYWWLNQRGLEIKDVLDPLANVRETYEIFKALGGLRNPVLGYSAWTSYKSGAFQKWQPQAIEAAKVVGAYP